MDHPENNNFIKLTDIIEKLWQGKFIIISCFSLTLLFGLLYNYFTTPVYRASTIITVGQYSKDNILNSDYSSSVHLANFVANRIKELKTLSFAEKMYEELSDSVRVLFRLPDPLPPDFKQKNYISHKLQKEILAMPIEKASNTIIIAFDSEYPELAQKLTNTAAKVLQKNNLKSRRKEYSNLRKFIDDQLVVVEKKLQAVEDSLLEFRSKSNISSLQDETKEILRRITEAENLYNRIKTDREATEKKLDLIRQKIIEQKETIGISVIGDSTPLINKLKEKFIELEVQYTNLRIQKYPENHPKTIELKNKIEDLRKKIIDATNEIVQEQKSEGLLDPLNQLKNYIEQSIVLETESESLQAQESHLENTLRSYNRRLNNLSTDEVIQFRLLRDQEVHNKNYIRLLEERERARLREAAEIGNINVIDPASVPSTPEKPKKLLNIIMAMFAGTFIGILLIFFKESISDAPNSSDELEQLLSMPVIASLSKIKTGGILSALNPAKKSLVMNNGNLDPFYQDSFSYLWNYLRTTNKRKFSTIMITSAIPREGKSTVASNLAITMAKLGYKTLLIDGDMRKPSIHEPFNLSKSPGLSDLISEAKKTKKNKSKPTPVINSTIQKTEKENLYVLTSGNIDLEPSVFWNSSILEDILKMLKPRADYIIIDMPPILGIPDAISLASHVDIMLLCVGQGESGKKILLNTQKILEHSKLNFSGIIWNKVDPISIFGKSKYRKYYKNYYSSKS